MARPRARNASPRTVRIVLSTAPPRVAGRIARALVDARVAACVNVIPGARSVYRWRGRVERATESVLFVKTTALSLRACLRALRAAHPYEVPEALVLTPSAGLTAYLRWVAENACRTRS